MKVRLLFILFIIFVRSMIFCVRMPDILRTNVDVYYTSVTIRWYTSYGPATSKVEYGTTTAYGFVYEDNEYVQFHKVDLVGLSRGTLYYFRISGRYPPDNRYFPNQEIEEKFRVDGAFTTGGAGLIEVRGKVLFVQFYNNDEKMKYVPAAGTEIEILAYKSSHKFYPGEEMSVNVVADKKGEFIAKLRPGEYLFGFKLDLDKLPPIIGKPIPENKRETYRMSVMVEPSTGYLIFLIYKCDYEDFVKVYYYYSHYLATTKPKVHNKLLELKNKFSR